MTDDLRTLAAEPFWAVVLPALPANADPRLLDLLTHALNAGLAAVEAAHRRQVLGEAADALLRFPLHDNRLPHDCLASAAAVVWRPASAAPETAPTPRHSDETAPAIPQATPEPETGHRAPVNPYVDAISQRAFSLIFNGLTAALTKQWMPLSERMRISEAIYETLRAGGVEIRLADGLAKLRQVAAELTEQGDG